MNGDQPIETTSEAPLLIGVRELSRLTGLSCGTIYHMISQGRLPVVRISNRCVKFRLEDVKAWIAEKFQPARSGG